MVDPEGRLLVDACVAGDAAARQRFQAQFLPLIYRFERGGHEHEAASRDFLTFLFDDDRLYRRLQSYGGKAPLGAYLWSCMLPDLLKQFRTMIRRRRLDTVSLDEQPGMTHSLGCADNDGASLSRAAELLELLSPDKRILFKLLYIEDFDLDATEIQVLAERTGRTIRDVLLRIETARQVVRSREAVQRARLDGAESAGQWIRLYQRRLTQIDEDMVALTPASARAARMQIQRDQLLRKVTKRERQQAERLRVGSHTVVTLPTEMVADLLGQRASTTRAQITRVRQELAALRSQDTANEVQTNDPR